MISEVLLVCVTFIGVGFVGDYSILLGVLLFSALIYLCTRNCLKDSESEGSLHGETETNLLRYLNIYTCKLGNIICRIICSVRWSYILIEARKVLYVCRVVRREVEDNEPQSNEGDSSVPVFSPKSNQSCSSDQSVDSEIRTIVDCILREYIKSWYHGKISQNNQFMSEAHYIVYDTLTAFCNSISNIDKKEICCHILQLYLHFFFHFKEALKKVCEPKCVSENVLEVCISKKKEMLENFKMHHWAMKDSMTEWFYLQSIMGSLIDSFGPVEFLSCPILHSVVVEILTRTVLYPLVNTLTDPDRLNSWILKLLQNILKGENDILERFLNASDKISSPVLSSATANVSVCNKPVILLSKHESFEAPQETYSSSQSNNIANNIFNTSISSSKLELSSERISNASSEMFENSASDISLSGSQVLLEPSIQIASDEQKQCLLFPCVNLKAISNENLSNKSLNLLDVHTKKCSNFLETARIKRSRSADYIRQMPHMVGLLPLNRSNRSIRLRGRDNKTFIQFKSEKHHSTDVEMAEEAIEQELPPLFTDVKITETLQQEDLGHNPYTLYCIQYKGIFQDTSDHESGTTLVRQAVNIKRRFREFLALQSRLEDNPSLKRSLKGIKVPSKWLATPFTHLDQKTIAERKLFLESYLQELCKRDDISRSPELQEFLAYGGDSSIAFVKKPSDISIPRIDKMIVRSVKGAFDLFRTALPNPLPEAIIPRESSENELDDSLDEPVSESDFQVFLVDFSKKDPDILDAMENFIRNIDENSSTGSYDSCTAISNSPKRLFHSLGISDHNSCNCSNTVSANDSSRAENHLASVIVDFVVESFHKLPGPETTSHVHLLKFLCGSFFERYIEDHLDGITKEKCARLLHTFHKAIWPEDKHGHKKGNKIHNLPEILTRIITAQHEELLNTNRFRPLFHHVLNPDKVSHATELIIGSIQNASLNRCFLFYALDVVIQSLCSKEM